MHRIAPVLRQLKSLPRMLPGIGSISGKVLAASSVMCLGLVTVALLHFSFAMDVQRGVADTPVAQDSSELKLQAVHQAHRSLVLSAFERPGTARQPAEIELIKAAGHRLVVLAGGLVTMRDPELRDAVDVMNRTGLDLFLDEDPQARSVEKLAGYMSASAALDRRLQAMALHRQMELQADASRLHASSEGFLWQSGVLSGLLAVIVLPLMLWWLKDLLLGIKAMSRAMHSIANCETEVAVPSTVGNDAFGKLARAVQVFKRNTIALQRNTDEIHRLANWFDLALNNMQRGMTIFDRDQRLVMCNERYREMYGVPETSAKPGTYFDDMLEAWFSGQDAGDPVERASAAKNFREAITSGGEFDSILTLNGRTISVSLKPMADGGWVDVHEDITDRIETDKRIRRLAKTDQLTGLMNRQTFMDTLAVAVEESQADRPVALLLLDVRKFKRINEIYSNAFGDEVLCQVARRLQDACVSDATVARVGGNNFAVIMPTDGEGDAMECAADICMALREPMDVDGYSIQVEIASGCAIAPAHGDTSSTLVQRAEFALQRAKHEKHRDFVMFDPKLEEAIRERQELEDDLRKAAGLGQLEMHYQPIVDIQERRVIVLEALMRWKHPTRGMVSPAAFIPIAEEAGLIGELGNWALHQACKDASGWRDDIAVAVNLSPVQFHSGDIHEAAHSALQASGLPAKRLELEVTESTLLNDEVGTRRSLKRLKAMGVKIALDDFGTGYASLSYLRSFPFDKIKIDQTFIRDLPRSPDCHAIVCSVVTLAGMLGMKTVAEGIETSEHLDQVADAGCTGVQGYYFSKPVPNTSVNDTIADCEVRLLDYDAVNQPTDRARPLARAGVASMP